MKKYYSMNAFRQKVYNHYHNYFFNQFMRKFKIEGELDYQDKYYLLKKMWGDGKIWASRVPHSETPENPSGVIYFAPFAVNDYNYRDFPVHVNVINMRATSFIPATPQKVDEDGVIGYIQPTMNGVKETVDFYVQLIVDVEMLIRTQTSRHKLPWLVLVNEEDKQRMKQLMAQIQGDDDTIFLDEKDMNSIQGMQLNTPYIIDKLYNYKQARENELLTYLGINNNGVQEKKEHLVVDEVNANNQIINENSDNFVDSLQEFFDRINELYGTHLTIEAKNQQVEVEDIEDKEDEENED